MRIAIHLGAHCTDNDQLLRSLLKSSDVLAEIGTCVPGPSRYRSLISEMVHKLNGEPANEATQDMLIESIVDIDGAKRLILSQDNFLGAPHRAFEQNTLYHLTERNVTRLRNLFPDYSVEFFIATRDIATFVPAMQAKIGDKANLSTIDPSQLYWSDVIHTIRDAAPDCTVTTWCNEDTPVLWPDILNRISNAPQNTDLKGARDILAKVIAPEGMTRLRKYLQTHPIVKETQRRRIFAAFLDKFAIDDEMEEAISLPGWSDEFVENLSAAYDADTDEIDEIPGVAALRY